jgi:5-methyltetrahydrofolate--homocysteine methyltransferase
LSDTCLTRQDAVGVLNNVLLPAMKEVGDKFGAGELILPFVLQSAEVMKKTVAYLETFMDKVEGSTKGTVVLATVYGDVHDIGKNLVKTILSNNGYTVHDLGKQVPANTIIEAAQQHNADAIGLSALLVSTSKQMPLIVNELARRGLDYPVLIGGAAINRKFGRRILFLEDGGEAYAPGVFYCKDAFEGLAVMDQLADPARRAPFVQQIIDEGYEEQGKPERRQREAVPGRRSSVRPAEVIPTPPFWGPKTIRQMPLEIVFKYLHKPELYRLSWGAKNAHGEEWERLEADFEARLARMQKDTLTRNTLIPRQCTASSRSTATRRPDCVGLCALCRANGNPPVKREVARFTFPRQTTGEYLCLSDYFAPVGDGRVDVAAFQVVTVGESASREFDRLQSADNYSEAYFFHGLAVQTAEATANYVHRHALRELGLPPGQGKRYSWGYPACPDLDQHALVFGLLPGAERELGLSLTASYQLVPVQRPAALVVHHPEAKYYCVEIDRVKQILGETD